MTAPADRPVQPEPYLRGCHWPPDAENPYPRCDPGPEGARLPADTRAAAEIPVGVRFVFEGEPDAVEVRYRTRTRELGHRGESAGTRFVLYRGDERRDEAPAILGEGSVRLRPGPGEAPATLYLPEGMRPVVSGLEAIGGSIRPAPSQPRWLCYGDSISEGWGASSPDRAWPQIVSRRFGLDVVVLAYGGAARGEAALAQEIAAKRADVLSVAYGTNCWTRTPQSAQAFAATLRDFLALVRSGHPRTPIVAMSPVLRPDAEHAPNVLGASLGDLRTAFERTIEALRTEGDAALIGVAGRDRVPEGAFRDGIHPDDAGHEALATHLGPLLAEAVRDSAGGRS